MIHFVLIQQNKVKVRILNRPVMNYDTVTNRLEDKIEQQKRLNEVD